MTVKEYARTHPTSIVAKAYAFSEHAHTGQKRKSGEPYIDHPRAVGDTLLSWHLDEATVAAGLLHDTVEDTSATLPDVSREFGEEIASLVDGVTKISHINYRGSEATAENLRKMILALSRDLRVIFVKLADRLHNMKTLKAFSPAKQKRIALETYDLYAPLAYRLGMQQVSGELMDLAFPYLYPAENRWLMQQAGNRYDERLAYLKKTKPLLERIFKEHNLVPLAIDFRAKRTSSLYKKLLRSDMDIEKVYDLVAMRVIMETVAECYAALGIVHQLWPPLPGRIKDYIAMPKPNGYRSLHTTVIGPEGKYIEIQIRTKEMHEEDEHGIAAHWIYAQDKSGKRFKQLGAKLSEETRWVEQLRAWQEAIGQSVDPDHFIQSMKVDFFKDRIFVITPHGDAIDLAAGSTPVDFAYHIHSELGDTCVGAKINGVFAPLNHELHSGDMVEILTQKRKQPSEDWLAFVKTSAAREHIKSALRKKTRRLQDRHMPMKTELRCVVEDRIGLLKEMLEIISRSHINVINVNTLHSPNMRLPVTKIEIGTADREKIEKLLVKLKRIKEVKEVQYQIV